MMPFQAAPQGMTNTVMAGRPVPPQQFPQSQASQQVRPFPSTPFLAGGQQFSQQMLPQGTQNPLSIGFPVMSQMGIMPQRTTFLPPNMIPWGSGSSQLAPRVPGSFPIQSTVPNIGQGQGQGSAGMGMGQGVTPGITQALNQLVQVGNQWNWGRREHGAESSSTAISSSDNETTTYSSSMMSDSDRDRSKMSRYKERDQNREWRNRRENTGRVREEGRGRFSQLMPPRRDSSHSRARDGRDRDGRDRARNDSEDR